VHKDSACVTFGGFNLKFHILVTSVFVDLQTVRYALKNFLLPNTHTQTQTHSELLFLLASYTTQALIRRHLFYHFYLFLQSFLGVSNVFPLHVMRVFFGSTITDPLILNLDTR